ncbi:MAG: DoxX family protein [Bacteroidia bacterium]|nr:DoxX family protein [Bacteroidia bacterium]
MDIILILKIGIAAIFALAVLGKISGKMDDAYSKWKIGKGFMYGIGAAEVIGVVGLFTKFDQWAAYLLLAIMVGAVFTLVSNREPLKEYVMAGLASALLIAYVIMTNS